MDERRVRGQAGQYRGGMNAYLFSGLVNQYHKGQFVDNCSTVILYGGDEAASWKVFEESLLAQNKAEDSAPVKVEKMVGAPVLEQLLTEAGANPIKWPELAEEVLRTIESTPLDDQEQGYWVDCDQCVRPGQLAFDPDYLRSGLPEEIRSGLNWSLDKTFFFLISVLTPPAAPAEMDEDDEERSRPAEGTAEDEEEFENAGEPDLDQRLSALPQLSEKELAVVIRARNSVVAAWLWRKYAAGGELAENPIQVEPLCAMVGIGGSAGT